MMTLMGINESLLLFQHSLARHKRKFHMLESYLLLVGIGGKEILRFIYITSIKSTNLNCKRNIEFTLNTVFPCVTRYTSIIDRFTQ